MPCQVQRHQWLKTELAQGCQPGLEPLGHVWPPDGLCHWAVGRGAEGAQCPRSGLTAKCLRSPQIGLVPCLSYLHAQIIVPNASQNMQVVMNLSCSITLEYFKKVDIDCIFLPL